MSVPGQNLLLLRCILGRQSRAWRNRDIDVIPIQFFFLAGDQSRSPVPAVYRYIEEGWRRSILSILIHFAQGIKIISLFVYNVDK